LLLLDAASLYFRAFFGIPTSIVAPDGSPVNAIRGFCDMVAAILRDYPPCGLVACLDLEWRPSWRVERVPSYKAHRLAPDGGEVVPDELTPQVPILLEILDAIGIATAGAADHEADDVIGTLVARAGGPVDIVTGDRDLFQLVDDGRGVRVLYTGRGVANLEIVDDSVIRRKYGVSGAGYADLALLRGDPSDGLPGALGIGEKGAAAMLAIHGTLPALLAAVDDLSAPLTPAQRRRLAAAREYLVVAEPVVRVAADAPVPEVDPTVPAAPRDAAALDVLAERWGVRSSVDRLLAGCAAAAG
jgi:5'-3' exonuclease